jgi:hypothetical protein
MYRRLAVLAVGVSVLFGVAPRANAAPIVIHGTTTGNAGQFGGCFYDAACTAFFRAGCPAALATPDGSTTSIEDVSTVAGKTFTFSWHDTTTKIADENAALGESVDSRVAVYAASSCTAPTVPILVLTTLTPSASATIPTGTRWLVVDPLDFASAVVWVATT